MMFHASFNAPKLDFLCNHEAIFDINVKDGHYNLDYTRASDTAIADRYATSFFADHTTGLNYVYFRLVPVTAEYRI
jgi:hypothetical protein